MGAGTRQPILGGHMSSTKSPGTQPTRELRSPVHLPGLIGSEDLDTEQFADSGGNPQRRRHGLDWHDQRVPLQLGGDLWHPPQQLSVPSVYVGAVLARDAFGL